MLTPYWEEGDYSGSPAPQVDLFSDVFAECTVPFYTMDLARRKDGTWMIIELGDAQVSGLPEAADPVAFYRRLRPSV